MISVSGVPGSLMSWHCSLPLPQSGAGLLTPLRVLVRLLEPEPVGGPGLDVRLAEADSEEGRRDPGG